jgi:hypothetical protein
MVGIGHGGHYYLICPRPNTGKLCDALSGWSTPQMGGMHPQLSFLGTLGSAEPSLRQMLLLPLLNSLLVARPSLFFLCLLHGPPLLITGRWALQSPALITLVLEGCLLGFLCWLGSAEPRPSPLPVLPPLVC